MQDLQIQIDAAQKALVESRSANNAHDQLKLRELAGRIHSLRKVYDGVVQHNAEFGGRQDFPVTQSNVIAAAAEPLDSNKPDGALAFAVVTFIGVAAGFGIGLLRDMRDRTFRTPAQLEAALDLDCIAMIRS